MKLSCALEKMRLKKNTFTKKVVFLFFLSISLEVVAGELESGSLTKKLSALYDDLDFEAGLQLAEKSLKTGGKSWEEHLDLLKWRALFLSALNRPSEDAYLKLLCLQPDFQPSASLSPKLRQPFEKAKAKALRPLQVGLLAPHEVLRDQNADFQFEKIDDCGWAQELRIHINFEESGEYKVFKVPVSMVTKKRITLKLNWPNALPKAIYWYAVAVDESNSLLWQEAAPHKPNFISVRDPNQVAKTEPVVAKTVEAQLSRPWYTRWWVWTIAGAAVAAAGVTTAVLMSRGTASGPINIPVNFKVGP